MPFLVVFCFLIFVSYPQPFVSSVLQLYEALFALNFAILSNFFFWSMLKLLWRIVKMNNMGVTGQF